MTIEVRDLSRSCWLVLETISRTPVDRVGWQKIRYHSQWFQLLGGIRGDFFIDLCMPIRGRFDGADRLTAGASPAIAALTQG